MIEFTWFDWIALFALVLLLALPDSAPPVAAAPDPAEERGPVQLAAHAPLVRPGCPQVRP